MKEQQHLAQKQHIWKKRLLILFLALLPITIGASMPVLALSVASAPGPRAPDNAAMVSSLSLNQALLPSPAQANTAHTNQASVDPTNLIGTPQLFDSRPCVAHPSAATCNGVYPSFPPHIDIAFANRMGASACFDKKSTNAEYLPLYPNANIATVILWHFPKCNTWSTQLIFTVPAKQIQDTTVEVYQENTNGFIQWWNSVNQLLPPVSSWESSAPQPFNQLAQGEQDFYLTYGVFSPMLYSVEAPIASEVRLDLTNDTHYDYETPFVNA